MNDGIGHLPSEILQAYLEGELEAERHREVETHLGACRRCAAELEGWRLLFRELDELPALGPSEGFGERVLTGLPSRASLPRRLWDGLRSLVAGAGRAAEEHLSPDALQDLLDGALTGRGRRRAEAHLTACRSCRTEVEAWQAVFRALEGLPALAPSPAFAERVMAEVEVDPAAAPAPEPVRTGVPGRLLEGLAAAARSLVPSTRKGWALAGGAVALPTAAVAAAFGAVAAHPLLTVRDLAAFLWWRAGDLPGAVGSWALQRVLETPFLAQAYGAVEALVASPGAAAAGLALLWTLTFAAALILYRNVLQPIFMAERHVRAS